MKKKLEEEVIKPEKKKEKKKLGIWDKLFNKKKLEKPNKVAVIYLRENGNAEPIEVEPKDGMFNIHGRNYHEDSDCSWVFTKERYPLAIIPEGSLIGIGKKSWEDKKLQEKFATLEDHAIKGIRHAERVRMGEGGSGMKLNLKSAILIGIAIIVIIAIFIGYK